MAQQDLWSFRPFGLRLCSNSHQEVEPSSHLLNLGWPRHHSDQWNAAEVTFWNIKLGTTYFLPLGVHPLCREAVEADLSPQGVRPWRLRDVPPRQVTTVYTTSSRTAQQRPGNPQSWREQLIVV